MTRLEDLITSAGELLGQVMDALNDTPEALTGPQGNALDAALTGDVSFYLRRIRHQVDRLTERAYAQ